MKNNKLTGSGLAQYKNLFATYGGLAVCLVFFTIVTPMFGHSIWAADKLSTLLSDVIVLGLLSVGAVFIYALGSMDISVGKQVGLYASLIVILGNQTGSLLPGILVSLVIALVIGAINGATGEMLHIHPIISSLVFMMVLSGVSSIMYNMLGSRNISLKTIDYRFLKQPWVMVLALVLEIIIVVYLFNFTKIGKNAKAIGANPVAAEQCGINIIRYKVICYLIMGVCVVLASIFQMGIAGAASDSTGTGFEMNVMVCLILGGMPLSGGMRSKVSSAVTGALTYSLLDVGLPIIGVSATGVFLVKAIIFIVVVMITCRKKTGVLPR